MPEASSLLWTISSQLHSISSPPAGTNDPIPFNHGGVAHPCWAYITLSQAALALVSP